MQKKSDMKKYIYHLHIKNSRTYMTMQIFFISQVLDTYLFIYLFVWLFVIVHSFLAVPELAKS